MTAIDPGLDRVLNNLDKGISDVRADIKHLEGRVEELAAGKVSKAEFDAYLELRRAAWRYAVTTVISIAVLLAMAVGIIIQAQPGG